MDLARVTALIASFLEKQQARFALIGGFALHAYGYSRLTRDLDLLTETRVSDRLVGFMEQNGYETLHASSGYSNHLHPDDEMGRVNFVYVDERTADQLFHAAKTSVTIGGVTVIVPSPEHLIAMKVLAISNEPRRTLQEMADIQFLMALPQTNLGRVRDYFERYGLLRRYDEIRELPT